MRNRQAIRNYRFALLNEQTAQTVARAFQPLSGRPAEINNWYQSSGPSNLGDIDGALDDIGSGVAKIFDAKTKKLENALMLIIGLSGVAALTGIVGLIKR